MKKKIIGYSLVAIISVIFFYFSSFLFYKQIVSTDGTFYSDLPAHIVFAREGTGYSLMDLLVGVMIRFVGLVPSLNEARVISWLGGLCVGLTVISLYVLLTVKFKIDEFCSLLISSFLISLTSLYIPYLSPYFDLTGIIRQPWHSYTYLGMRLGAIWVIYFLIGRMDNPRREGKWKAFIGMTVSLLLTTWCKPNFLISYSLALLIWLIIVWIKGKFRKEVTLDCIFLGVTVLPSVAVAYLQSVLLFGESDSSSGITLALLNSPFFKNGGRAVILQIFTCLALPMVVYLFNIKNVDKIYYFCLLMFAVSFVEIVLFMETGNRSDDNNFYWGVFLSAFFLYMMTFVWMIKGIKKMNKKKQIPFIVVCTVFIAWFIASEILYVRVVWSGSNNVWPYIYEPYFKWLNIMNS